jgi:integrase
VKRYLSHYKKYILSVVDKAKSLQYFKQLHEQCSTSYYKRQMYQIKRFLKFLKIGWAEEIKLPKDPEYTVKRILKQDITDMLNHFSYSKQIVALIHLGCTSSIRAKELYQLNPEDISIENRVVSIHHNPKHGQTTKTGKSRISFFNQQAQEALKQYLIEFNNTPTKKVLFSPTSIKRNLNGYPIRVKDFRKFFSQEWERRNGNHQIKERLMGHSLKSVDARHYSCLSVDELKTVYDNVMNS